MAMQRRMNPVVASLIFIGVVMAGCGSPPPSGTFPDPAGGLDAREAPMLTALVQAGKLPPVEQRLPIDPLIVKPYERPGEYGGTWRTFVDNPDLGMYKMMNGYAPLIRWKSDCSGLEPGTAKSWSLSEDGATLTLKLRRGIRWSDGVEFTSADFAYWGKLISEGKQRLSRPFWSFVDGKPMRVETPDRYTVVLKFAGPNWFAPLHLATGWWWNDEYNTPKHYLQQFDPQFNPKYKDYSEFDKRNFSHFNPERPTLWPWGLKRIEDGGFRMVFERNPFYYMVDPLGRQLPYIDKVIATYVPDTQLRVLKLLSGEIDGQFRLVELRDLELYTEGRRNGKFRILRWKEGTGSQTGFILNWSPPDPVNRDLIRDVRFRKALSHAIDRAKCNEVVFRGLGRPQQATISREAWHFKSPEGRKVFEDWAKSYAEFDIPRANQYLDEMGLTRRDAGGYRLRPDGKRLSLMIDVPPQSVPGPETDEALILADGWKQLGIEPIIKTWPSTRHLLRKRLGAFTVSTHGEAEMDLFTYPDWVFPTTDTYWHAQIGKWYKTAGKKGEAPTGIMKRLLDMYAAMMKEPDIEKRHRIVHEAVRLHTREGLFTLGTVADLPQLVIVRENMRNVPEDPRILGPWAVAGPATSYPESFFYSSAAR